MKKISLLLLAFSIILPAIAQEKQVLSLAELDEKPMIDWDDVEGVDPDDVYRLSLTYVEEIPDLSKFKNLQSFTLLICAEMDLNKELEKLKSIENLIQLEICGHYTKKFPKIVLDFKDLKSLTISGMKDLKKLPDELTSLDKLERLRFGEGLTGGCGFKKFPTVLVEMKHLRDISFYQCLEMKITDEFYQMPWIEKLDMGQSPNYDFGRLCESFPNLLELDIQLFSETSLKNLEKLTKLEALYMGYTEILESLGKINELKNLKEIMILIIPAYNSKEELQKLSEIESLESLVLVYDKECGDKFVFPYTGFENLTSLSIETRSEISLIEVVRSLERLTNLRTLSFRGFKSKLFPKQLLSFTYLEELTFARMSFTKLPSNFGNLDLKKLQIYNCWVNSLPGSILNMEDLESLTLNYTGVSATSFEIIELRSRGVKIVIDHEELE